MSTLSFQRSKPLTVGLELEWQILDAQTNKMTNQSVDLLKALDTEKNPLARQFKPESVRSMIEVNSTVHETPASLLCELYTLQDMIIPHLHTLNLALSGGGTYPSDAWDKSEIHPDWRYIKLHNIYGFLLKQFAVYGQHIHIGCDTPENMLYLAHAFGPYIPHFIALSAASPFYMGIDTYFDCSRLNMMSTFPTSGTLPFITDWNEFQNYFIQLCKFRLVNSMKDLYWDIRPKPEFGTVELRICDSPLTLKKAVALAAYAQALGAYLLDKRPKIDESIYIPYKYNRFSAMRYGLDAYILDIKTDEEKPLNKTIYETLQIIKPYAATFKSEALLADLEYECQSKQCDAHLLRTVFEREHSLSAVIKYSIDAWLSR